MRRFFEPRQQQQQYAPAQYQQQNLDNYDCDEYSDSAGYYDMNYADCLDSMDEDMGAYMRFICAFVNLTNLQ